MPYNEILAGRIEKFLSSKRVPFDRKPMMGGLVFMVNGKMCVGVEQARLMARIDPAAQAAALSRKGCRPMDFTGRPMRGFVFVSTEVLNTDQQLESWLNLALAFNPKAVASKRGKAQARPRKLRP